MHVADRRQSSFHCAMGTWNHTDVSSLLTGPQATSEVCTSTNVLLSYRMYVAAHTYMFILELEDFPRNRTRKVFYSGSEEPGGGNSREGQTSLFVYRFEF